MNTREHEIIAREHSEQMLLWFCYILNLLIVTAPVACAITTLKSIEYKKAVNDVTNGPSCNIVYYLSSHYKWINNTYVSSALLAIIAASAYFLGLGYICAGILLAWWFYRLVRGLLNLVEARPANVWSAAVLNQKDDKI